MQVKNYSVKNSLELSDILEVLTANFSRSVWSASSQLKDSHVALLNQVFALSHLQLPPAKEVEQKLLSSQTDEKIASNLTVTDKTELVQAISESIPSLTTSSIQELHAEIQTSAIEELAQENAVADYLTYQQNYDETTRSLIVQDIYQKVNERQARRLAAEAKRKAIAEAQPQPEQSQDALTGLLEILKRDNYKNQFLIDKFGGL